MVGGDSAGELNTCFTLGLQVKFEHTKVVAFGEDLVGLLSKISIVWGGFWFFLKKISFKIRDTRLTKKYVASGSLTLKY